MTKRLIKLINSLRDRWIRASSGFTLMEAMMTLFIFVIIGGACYISLNSGMRSWRVNSVQIELQQELRKAMDWMTEDLRQSGTSGSVMNVPADGTWYTSVTFRKAENVSGSSIVWSTGTFQYVLGGNGNHTLQRISSSGTQVIANNILSLNIRRLSTSPRLVEVKIQAQKTTLGGGLLEGQTSFKVRLRNG